jgi:hypothetical protein
MRLRLASSALLLSMLASINSALAQYPDQPVKVVVPFAAGGFMDTVARVATERLARSLGRPLMIENRAGAGGRIAEEFVANSKPDARNKLASSSFAGDCFRLFGSVGVDSAPSVVAFRFAFSVFPSQRSVLAAVHACRELSIPSILHKFCRLNSLRYLVVFVPDIMNTPSPR